MLWLGFDFAYFAFDSLGIVWFGLVWLSSSPVRCSKDEMQRLTARGWGVVGWLDVRVEWFVLLWDGLKMVLGIVG